MLPPVGVVWPISLGFAPNHVVGSLRCRLPRMPHRCGVSSGMLLRADGAPGIGLRAVWTTCVLALFCSVLSPICPLDITCNVVEPRRRVASSAEHDVQHCRLALPQRRICHLHERESTPHARTKNSPGKGNDVLRKRECQHRDSYCKACAWSRSVKWLESARFSFLNLLFSFCPWSFARRRRLDVHEKYVASVVGRDCPCAVRNFAVDSVARWIPCTSFRTAGRTVCSRYKSHHSAEGHGSKNCIPGGMT